MTWGAGLASIEKKWFLGLLGVIRRYAVSILVWYEVHDDIGAAIAREKQIKGWNRAWKIRLIEKTIPAGMIWHRV
jgi:predicted GIY-YIG superfamily endonuclease